MHGEFLKKISTCGFLFTFVSGVTLLANFASFRNLDIPGSFGKLLSLDRGFFGLHNCGEQHHMVFIMIPQSFLPELNLLVDSPPNSS